MPFALTTIGLFMIVIGFQDTYKQAGTLIAGDLTGKNNFIYWIAAMGIVGGLGYIKGLENFSRALLALVLVVIFLSNKGFFAQLSSSLSSGTSQAPATIGANLQGGSSGSSVSSSTSGGVSGILGDVGTAATFAAFN
jgi:hypothetical protein